MPAAEQSHDEARYRDFVRAAAESLRTEPDNALSLVSGRAFLQLGPRCYELVSEGCARFGRSRETLYDDVMGALGEPVRFTPGRVARGVALVLRALAMALCVVLPVSLRGSRSESVEPLVPRPASPPRRQPPTASVVVLSFDRLTYLRETLQAFHDTAGDAGAELIVVDQGSTDGSAAFLEKELARGTLAKLALRDRNHGISSGYNLGFALADPGAPFLMKLDSDIRLLTPGWLPEAADFLSRHEDVGFVALNQVNHSMLRTLPVERVDGRRVMEFGGWPCGSAMLIRRRLHDELGCFVEHDELAYVPDDIDYYSRARRLGYRVYFLHDLWVHHQVHLDRSRYRPLDRTKPRGDSASLALELARAYDRGTRPLALRDARYAQLALALSPDGLLREETSGAT